MESIPNSEIAAAAAVNEASRLWYTNPGQGQTVGGSSGLLSLLSRGIRLSSTGIYKHWESVSQTEAAELLKNCLAKSFLYQLKCST